MANLANLIVRGLTRLGVVTASKVTADSFVGTATGAEYIRGTWTAATYAWTGVTKDSELYDNKEIVLFLPFGGNYTATTLNLTLSDGTTTGAKNVYFNSTTRHTNHYGQYQMVRMVYHKAHIINGTTYEGWWMDYARDTNDMAHNTYYYYERYKTTTVLYRYQICFQDSDTSLIPVNTVSNSTDTTKTLTTASFRPFGLILFHNNANTVNANTVIPDGRLYDAWPVDLRYSFNTGTTLTSNKSVYLVCVPQSDGLVKLYSDPISQDLPESDNGLYYIYLGVAYSTSNIQLMRFHPVFMYKNGAVREISQYAEKAGDASTVNGHTVEANVPSNAVFTDTTYTPASSNPAMDGTAAVGTSSKYAREDHVHPSDTSRVPTTRTVNNKALSSDITLSASDVSAVPTTRKVNNKALSSDISLTASDVSAIPTSQKGVASGVAELDSNGLVPTSQLPSYVDDVLEYSSKSSFPTTGETGKIYVDTSTNLTYRWSGSAYVEISPSLALGTTSSTAFRGDYGNSAYAHAVTNKGSAFTSGLYKITTNAEGHVTAASEVVKSDITGLGIPGSDTNNAVTQTATTTSSDYEVLFSATADNTTRTEGARKNNNLTFNPNTGNLKVTKINGVAVGSSPKFTDTNTTYTATSEEIGTASAGTNIPADDITSWSAGSTPTLGTAISADDITSWSAGTAASASVLKGVLTITDGTAPSLSYTGKSIPNVTSVGSVPTLEYTAKSIPNISVTTKSVVTEITAD